MTSDGKKVLVIVGIRASSDRLQHVVDVLSAYYEKHRDRFLQNIQLQKGEAEGYNVWLAIRCAEGEDIAFWSNDFTSYLTEQEVGWSA